MMRDFGGRQCRANADGVVIQCYDARELLVCSAVHHMQVLVISFLVNALGCSWAPRRCAWASHLAQLGVR